MRFGKTLQQVLIGAQFIKLYAPDEMALRQAYEAGKIPFPYWGKLWPAAKALAQWVATHPETVTGKNVLEIGGGLGLPSLVTAQYAGSVLCTDVDADALEYVAASAEDLNHHHLITEVLDWHQMPDDVDADVVLMSDVNYDPDAFAPLLQTIQHFLQNKTTVILSTPQRLMAKPFVEALLPHVVQQQSLVVEDRAISILLLQNV